MSRVAGTWEGPATMEITRQWPRSRKTLGDNTSTPQIIIATVISGILGAGSVTHQMNHYDQKDFVSGKFEWKTIEEKTADKGGRIKKLLPDIKVWRIKNTLTCNTLIVACTTNICRKREWWAITKGLRCKGNQSNVTQDADMWVACVLKVQTRQTSAPLHPIHPKRPRWPQIQIHKDKTHKRHNNTNTNAHRFPITKPLCTEKNRG